MKANTDTLILKFHAEGMKRKLMAKKAKTSVSNISNILKKHGLTMPKLKLDHTLICELLKKGNSVKEVAKLVNCCEDRVYKIAKKNNLYKSKTITFYSTLDEVKQKL